MVYTPPTQFRSVDPYAENRWSTVINRISRIVTGGEDAIFFPGESFLFTRKSNTEITISPGICVKDDVTIHITANFDLDFSDTNSYLDDTGGLTQAGWYYIVLYYVYDRKYPAPEAYYRIIKDRDILIDYSDNFIFLGSVKIEGTTTFTIGLDPEDILYYDPVTPPTIGRNYIEWDGLVVDGGVLPGCLT